MKTFLTHIISEIHPFSRKLSDTELLINVFWVLIDDTGEKTIYIFRENKELLITRKEKIDKVSWAYIGENSIFIEKEDGKYSYLFSHAFFDPSCLLLRVNGKEGYVFLVSEDQYDKGIDSKEEVERMLKNKYIKPNILEPFHRAPGKARRGRIPTYFAVNENTKLLRSSFIKFEVVFSEGISGEVFVNKKNGSAYFKKVEKPGKLSFSPKCRYKNPKDCISALHHYLTTGKVPGEETLQHATVQEETKDQARRNKKLIVRGILPPEIDKFYD